VSEGTILDEPQRATARRALEQDAELLVVYQLDLLAQIEAPLIAVHRTMRAIATHTTRRSS
jgi:hypothetical protein